MPHVHALLTGQLAPLGPAGVPSGIGKRPVEGAVWLGAEGLAGDAQGDRRHHGGPEKALHHYPLDHYDWWQGELGALPLLAAPGGFGENLSVAGISEAEVAIGDIFRIGGALVQVSQGRQPCWKLNARFDVADMAARVQASGRTGWYYRVIEEGAIATGDALLLVDRPTPDWTISRLWRAFYVDPLGLEELAGMADLALLAESWRRYAARRIATGAVEDWSLRLTGG